MFYNTNGLSALIQTTRGRGDFTDLTHIRSHPAHRLLRQYARRGVPVTYSTAPWPSSRVHAAVKRGPHKSAYEYEEFLREEMIDFIRKGYWFLLPYSLARHLPNIRIAPLGVVPQHSRRPRVICDFTFHGQNQDTLPIVATEAMQFGRALERYLREIVLADPRFGPVKMIKVDLSDGFYRIWVRCDDVPKLGMAFPTPNGEDPLIAFPVALPMGWKNSPPAFSTATETIADIANQRLLKNRKQHPHRLDRDADTPPAESSPLQLSQRSATVVPPPTDRDPALNIRRPRRTAYFDIFVDDFLGLAQGNDRRLRYVRRVLLNTIDDVFRPLDEHDSHRKEPTSVKKLRAGDASWQTVKEILGWILNTTEMTLTLTPRRAARLAELLDSITPAQRRLSVKTWHKILGELRSMAIALPGSRGLFSLLQEAFRSEDSRSRITLTSAVHSILDDFRWLLTELESRPTRLYELVPLQPTLVGAHDAAGHGAGGVWFPTTQAVSRRTQLQGARGRHQQTPIVWRLPFPTRVQRELVTFQNPSGAITNSDLELAGGLLHLEAAAQCFDIRERTILSKTDNMATMYWNRKGSATTTSAPAYLLRMYSYHRRYHRYIPLHDYIQGTVNAMADDASRLQHLSNRDFLAHFNSTYPQRQSWQLWTPTLPLSSATITSLFRKPSDPASWLAGPPPPIPLGPNGAISARHWPSIPYSATSKILSSSSKSLPTGTESAVPPPAVNPSDLVPLKMPYGMLARRSLVWGPRIRA